MPALLASFIAIASAYCCNGRGGGYCGTTAGGYQVGPGQIAADPRVLPMGTRVYVEGYGPATVTDTGGAIVGNHIDVWFRDCDDAWKWGKHPARVTVGGVAPDAPAAAPYVAETATYPDNGRWITVTRWHDPATGAEWDAFTAGVAP